LFLWGNVAGAYIHLEPVLRMHGNLPPLPVYAFVEWCLDTGAASCLSFDL